MRALVAPRERVPRPPLPETRPRVDREAYRDLRGSAPAGGLDDVVKAYGAAGEALAAGDPAAALPYLRWARQAAPRSAVVREALGIAAYQLGAYAEALAELTAYRRIAGRQDQNHLLADSSRATGHPERVEDLVEAMTGDPDVPRINQIEGLLVLSGTRADADDLRGALAVLERGADLNPTRVESWHPRVWYAAADLHDRLGETEDARGYLEAVVAIDDDFLDAADRLAAMP